MAAAAIESLWARFESLRTQDQLSLSDDERRSLRYYLIERGLKAEALRREPRRSFVAEENWVRRLTLLEAYLDSHGRWPRSRAPHRADVLPYDRHLDDWRQHQKQKVAVLCTYQRARLECIPDWRWECNEDAWDKQLERWREFVGANGRRPTRRGLTAEERSLATWMGTQRRLRREGKLPCHRAEDLMQLPLWSWGKESPRQSGAEA